MAEVLTKVDLADLSEQFNGLVEHHLQEVLMLGNRVKPVDVTGMGTYSTRRTSGAKVSSITPGSEPPVGQGGFDKVSVSVDTIAISREAVFQLDELVSDISILKARATEQADAIADWIDDTHLRMAIKGATMSDTVAGDGVDDTPRVYAGKNVTFALAGDEDDADLLFDKIGELAKAMVKDRIKITDDFTLYIAPDQYQLLATYDKLIDEQLNSGNGDVSLREVKKCHGFVIEETPLLPMAAGTHILSNTSNSSKYDLDATDAKCIAVLYNDKAFLDAKIDLGPAKVWWYENTKMHYSDVTAAIGKTVKRPDYCGGVFTA